MYNYLSEDPGSWPNFVLRSDNVGLQLNEVKQKFIKEQVEYENMMAFQNDAGPGGGIPANPVLSVAFDAAAISVVSGFTSDITVTFTNPLLSVTGTPTLQCGNSLAGGGLTPTVYSYNAGASDLSAGEVVFRKTQGANVDGALDVGAGKITGKNLKTDAGFTEANTLTGVDTAQTITGVSATYTGGGAGVQGEDVVCTVAITAGGVVTSALITSITDEAGSYYIPSDTLTIAFGELTGTNADGGSLVYTIGAAGLLVDTIATPLDINYNSGASSINGLDNRLVWNSSLPLATKVASAT